MGADWNYPLLVLQQALEPITPHVQERTHYDFTTYMDTTYSDARQSKANKHYYRNIYTT